MSERMMVERKLREYMMPSYGPNPCMLHMPQRSAVLSVYAKDGALCITALIEDDASLAVHEFYVLAAWDTFPQRWDLSFVGTAVWEIPPMHPPPLLPAPKVYESRHVFQVCTQPWMTLRL